MPEYQIYWYNVKLKDSNKEILVPVPVHNGRATVVDGGITETSVDCLPPPHRVDTFESKKTTSEFYKEVEKRCKSRDMNAGKLSTAIYEFLGSFNNATVVALLGVACASNPEIAVGALIAYLGLAAGASSSRSSGF